MNAPGVGMKTVVLALIKTLKIQEKKGQITGEQGLMAAQKYMSGGVT
jgi:hypothetical protein